MLLQVGNQFVSQFYTVQHASPKHLHRFYSDASTLTYGDMRPEGFFSKSATGQKVGCLETCGLGQAWCWLCVDGAGDARPSGGLLAVPPASPLQGCPAPL